ncbi:hypothetical protein MY04_1211 [Flammeovirga sp. MY04]|uniref:toxin-antitoxin system YwqK family antitoxin n=1 Tax=Flammeovirga sp. MY04 TaxID=1191459 RepID=UPI0013053C7E|nr:hypothetical protein [Flammeovirga sp. MY04]ANQ48588.2 hypothetical protein MY04_1211 [Flammeovirga sp. MY04]
MRKSFVRSIRIKYSILLIILLIAHLICVAQDDKKMTISTNRLDEYGLKSGVWNIYKNGSLKSISNYSKGEYHGYHISFLNDSTIGSLSIYDEGKQVSNFLFSDNKLWRRSIDTSNVSFQIDYYSNQLPKTGGFYPKGNGVKVDYSEVGKVNSITVIKLYQVDGHYTHFYNNGQLREHGIRKNTFPWTVFCVYDSLGNSIDFGNLKNGSGTLKLYHDNGELYKVEEYREGLYWNTKKVYSAMKLKLNKGSIKNGDGEVIDYYMDGSIKSKTSFEKGLKNGVYISYHKNGEVKEIGVYFNNKKHNEWEHYSESGNLESSYLYQNGKVREIRGVD